MKNNSFYFLVLMLIATFSVLEAFQNACSNKTTCSGCIQNQRCAWCAMQEFGEEPRCVKINKTSDRCFEEFLVNPRNEEIIIENFALTRGSDLVVGHTILQGEPGETGQLIAISPQKVYLKLRKSAFR
jgi:Integrin plexin domain